MTTPTLIYRYPLDGTGVSPDNLVVGEEHQLSTRPVRCIAPSYGGFFAESVVVKDLATDLPLIYGIDYTFGELFEFPTGRYGKEIFGLIVITKPNVTAIRINYQALGGDYSYSMDAIIQMVDSLNLGDRPVAWGEIVGHPIMFDPASHMHDIGDVYGFEYVVHSIERLRAAVLLGDVASHDEIYRYIDRVASEQATAINDVLTALNAHIADKNNPHTTTKTQVGLGSVQNYATASQAQMDVGTANNLYVTPDIVAKYVTDKAVTPLTTHIADKANPHATTKAQVGLNLVDNYATADVSTATAGTATDKFMTPYLVEQCVKPVRDSLTLHTGSTNNPHATTKTHVGLGSVQNYATATQAQMDTGTASNLYVTPNIVAKYVADKAGTALTAHIGSTNNPHATTKTQVGLSNVDNYATSDLSTANAGIATDKFMTPYLVEQRVKPVRDSLTSHVGSTNNPHATTKTHVGLSNVNNYGTATDAEAAAGTATNLHITPKSLNFVVSPLSQAINTLATYAASKADSTHTHSSLINGGYSATLGANGTLNVTDLQISSDERLKQDWWDVDCLIENLALVKNGSYVLTENGMRYYGVSAQSVECSFPYAVGTNEDGIKSVAYGNLALVACIKLSEEVLALRAKIEALKTNDD